MITMIASFLVIAGAIAGFGIYSVRNSSAKLKEYKAGLKKRRIAARKMQHEGTAKQSQPVQQPQASAQYESDDAYVIKIRSRTEQMLEEVMALKESQIKAKLELEIRNEIQKEKEATSRFYEALKSNVPPPTAMSFEKPKPYGGSMLTFSEMNKLTNQQLNAPLSKDFLTHLSTLYWSGIGSHGASISSFYPSTPLDYNTNWCLLKVDSDGLAAYTCFNLGDEKKSNQHSADLEKLTGIIKEFRKNISKGDNE